MSRIELAEGVASLPRSEWDALVGAGSPFLEWDWLASLEEAGCVGAETGWLPRPLVARDDAGRLVAACPVYVKGHSEGEFVFDWGWADAAYNAGIEYYPKLLVGVPFTPVGGSRFLVAPHADRREWVARLATALRELCVGNRLSSVHVNFCSEEEQGMLGAAGYLARVGIQYHWSNEGYRDFEDYLARFRSKRRNQIRRERRELERQGIEIRTLAGDEIGDDLIAPMFDFYRATVHARHWGRQYLNRRFFELAVERFRRNLVFVVATSGGTPVAGTFNVAKQEAMYGRYWGTARPVRHLHFNVCYYAAIEHCIERGLSRFEPGAGGDYKQVRGFDARPTHSAHFMSDPRLAAAIARFLDGERREAGETLEWLTEESALKRP